MLYTYILAGAIFSIGFKYAGTGNRNIFELIKKFDTFRIIQTGKVLANVYTGCYSNEID